MSTPWTPMALLLMWVDHGSVSGRFIRRGICPLSLKVHTHTHTRWSIPIPPLSFFPLQLMSSRNCCYSFGSTCSGNLPARSKAKDPSRPQNSELNPQSKAWFRSDRSKTLSAQCNEKSRLGVGSRVRSFGDSSGYTILHNHFLL